MKNLVTNLLATIVIAIATFATAAVAQDCASQSGIVVHPGQGAQFTQISYSFEEVLATVGLQPSSTGRIDVDVSQMENISSSGYINVVTAAGWVVQNLPILPGFYDQYGYQFISTTLNLNVPLGNTVTSLGATVCYSSQVLNQISSSSFDTFTVGSDEYNAEGVGGVSMSDIPAAPPAGAMNFQQNGPTQFVMQNNHQNVQTANNQCAPASVANNFTWLNTTYNTPFTDANIKGLRGNPNNSMVGNLDMTMQSIKNARTCELNAAGRWAVSRGQGAGVPALNQLQGLMQYLSAVNVNNLTLKHQGTSPFMCDAFNGGQNVAWAGLTSTGQGATVTFNFIQNELTAGSAVEMDGVWYNRFGPAGGHAVDIIGAGTTNGRPWIAYVSDNLQTDRDPSDRLGTGRVDYSWIVATSGQPGLLSGPLNGAYAVAVMTQHP